MSDDVPVFFTLALSESLDIIRGEQLTAATAKIREIFAAFLKPIYLNAHVIVMPAKGIGLYR
jgi:hypothetical protein